MKPRLQWFIHPVFLVCLALLLINDLFLKYTYGNWFTGKISDITGLIAFTISGFAVSGADRKKIILLISLFFLWWKSPMSEPVLSFLNQRLHLPVARVVDYSDYLALCFLPLTWRLRLPELTPVKGQRILITGSGLISLFAFCATSMPYRNWYNYYREEEIPFSVQITTKKTDKEIMYALDPQRQGWRIDSVRYLPYHDNIRPYYQLKQADDSVARWVPLPDSLQVPLYYRFVSQPFYILPQYILDGDTLHAVEFSMQNPDIKDKKRLISFRSFRSPDKKKYQYFFDTPLYKKYKKHFIQLLRGK